MVSSAKQSLREEVGSFTQASKALSNNGADELKVDLLFLEDFDSEIDNQFINTELKPYFSGIFSDLALRSTPAPSKS